MSILVRDSVEKYKWGKYRLDFISATPGPSSGISLADQHNPLPSSLHLQVCQRLEQLKLL